MYDLVSALAVVSLIDQTPYYSTEECGAGILNRFIKSVEVNCMVTCSNCLIENISITPEGNPTWFFEQHSLVPIES
jgi:hypothetical protein